MIAQEAVVSLHVAAGHGARVRARLPEGRRERRIVHVAANEEVDLAVRQHAQAEQRAPVPTEVARTLAADRDELVGGLADVVLCVGVRDAVRE